MGCMEATGLGIKSSFPTGSAHQLAGPFLSLSFPSCKVTNFIRMLWEIWQLGSWHRVSKRGSWTPLVKPKTASVSQTHGTNFCINF